MPSSVWEGICLQKTERHCSNRAYVRLDDLSLMVKSESDKQLSRSLGGYGFPLRLDASFIFAKSVKTFFSS